MSPDSERFRIVLAAPHPAAPHAYGVWLELHCEPTIEAAMRWVTDVFDGQVEWTGAGGAWVHMPDDLPPTIQRAVADNISD